MQHETPTATTDGRTELVSFMVGASSPQPSKPLRPTDLEALWNGSPQAIQSVDRIAAGAPDPDESMYWKVVVYVDAPLTTVQGFHRATKLLRQRAEQLTALGPVTVVVADPQPQIHGSQIAKAALLERSLEDLREAALGLGELVWLRQRFSMDGSAESSEIDAIEALRREAELLEQRRIDLLRSARELASAGPKLLLLIQDGFDANPRHFYAPESAISLREDPTIEPRISDVAQTLASEGWVVVPLALAPDRDLLSDPFSPLVAMAEMTGGELVRGRRQLVSALDRLAASYWVTLRVAVEAPFEGGRIEVRELASGRRLVAPGWISATTTPGRQVADSAAPEDRPELAFEMEPQGPAIELLRPPGLDISGPTRFRVIAAHHRVDRVDFWRNGKLVGSDRRAPYEVVLDLDPRAETVDARAFDVNGTELGNDRVVVNELHAAPELAISTSIADASHRWLEIEALVGNADEAPERVDFYFNERRTHSLSQPPFVVQVDSDELDRRDFVRVVAIFPDGSEVESATMAMSETPIDELDVNTIEILATVTSKRREEIPDLESADFVVHGAAGPVSIDQFSRSDHLPLAIGLLLDTSDSMNHVIESVGLAAEQFFDQALGPEDVAFVVDFDTRPKLALPPTSDTTELMRSIRGLQARGDTALYDSIAFALQQFEPEARRKALIVITDGLDSARGLLPGSCIEQARQYGVPVYLIVIGSPPSPRDRRQVFFTGTIARQTGGRIFYLTNLENLDQIYSHISTELRSQYLFAVSTDRTLSPKELEEIRIEVLRKDLNVRAVLASQHHDS